jgi:hypothetical protein
VVSVVDVKTGCFGILEITFDWRITTFSGELFKSKAAGISVKKEAGIMWFLDFFFFFF